MRIRAGTLAEGRRKLKSRKNRGAPSPAAARLWLAHAKTLRGEKNPDWESCQAGAVHDRTPAPLIQSLFLESAALPVP